MTDAPADGRNLTPLALAVVKISSPPEMSAS